MNESSTGGSNDKHSLSQFPFVPGVNFFIVTIHTTVPTPSVQDPGISSEFLALTDSTEYVAVLILLECTGRLCVFAYSNSKTRVGSRTTMVREVIQFAISFGNISYY